MKRAVLIFALCLAPAHATPAGDCDRNLSETYVTTPLDPLFAARDRRAQIFAKPQTVRLNELKARLPTLRRQTDTLKGEVSLWTRTLGVFKPMGDDHALYVQSRDALRAAERETKDLEAEYQADLARADGEVRKDLATLAKTIFVGALLDPPPGWARNLSVVGLEVDAATATNELSAVVNLIADPKPNPSGKPQKTSRPYTVVIRATRGQSRVKGGVVFDEALRAANPYLYDAFKIGRVVDVRLQPVAHTSLDLRASQLHLHHVAPDVRAAVVARQRENPTLRRQVQQVLYAALALRRASSDDNVSIAERDLLKAYLNYWAHAERLAPGNMLKSAFMIRALLATPSQQEVLADVLNAEVRRRDATFSRDRLKSALALRLNRARVYATTNSSSTSTTSGSDDSFMWYWFWTQQNDTTYVGPKLPFHDQLSGAMGAKSVDDPVFIQNEYASDPLNTAVDTYVNDAGHSVTAHQTGDTHSESGPSSESSGGSGGDGDGDGDGDGG